MAFAAKYAGVCASCGDRFEAGEMIESNFGKGYVHVGHDRSAMAAAVTERSMLEQHKKKASPGGIVKVADGAVGTCERCMSIGVVYSVKLAGKTKRVQVCTKCHSSLVVPLRSRPD